MRYVSENIVERLKSHILIVNNFFRKSHRLWDNVEKFGEDSRGHKWRHKIAHTRYMLDKRGYTHAAHAHAYATGHPHTREHT
jgi:hypothetical protein